VGAAGAAVIIFAAWATRAEWHPLQWILAVIVAFDVLGGVVANGLNSAKRAHIAAPAPGMSVLERVVRRPVLFTALHVHPIVIGLVYLPQLWWWGPVWYLVTLIGTAVVSTVPMYLARPAALAVVALAAMGAAFTPNPPLWGWLPVMLTLKLVLAHAVKEQPYEIGSD
jgi:hypothetical protein